MFMTAQPWDGEDYTKLITNLEPPPPPSTDAAWELQFCKWWGWNWVKKREEEVDEAPIQKSMAPKAVEVKPPEKKPVKNLCRCLCFKKKKRDSLQDKYNTPSNSEIDHKEQSPDNTSFSKEPVERTDSIIEKEIEEQITKDAATKVYGANSRQKKKKRTSKEWSSSSSDGCHCRCRDRNRSSTDESVEYINITCCGCCNSKEPLVTHNTKTTKSTNEKYTQDDQPEGRVIATQTEIKENKEKKHRRKRICVVCCCGCKRNYPPSCCPCCSCGNIGKAEDKTKKGTEHSEPRYYKRENPLLERNKNAFSTYRASKDQHSPNESMCQKPPKHLRHKFEPLYATGMPIDTMLYQNKPIPKFGMPSQNYSWIHATKSDIWDQFSHFRTSNGPVSPTKLFDLESEPSGFGPISVDKELETLKKIESDIKMDLKSRVMLDAICDAILTKNKDPENSSSIFLNEFTYPSNVAQTDFVTRDAYKPEQKNTCSKLNQTGLDRIVFEDTVKRKSIVSSEANTSSLNLSVDNQENTSLRDYVNIRSPQTYSYNRRLFRDPCFAYREYSTSNPNKHPYKLLKYTAADPRIPTRKPLIPRAKLAPTSKRCASPSPRGRDIKKVKLEDASTLAELDSTNVSDIFKKIDEIVLRSKVNNEEIQSVLNTIPKRTYKFFTSWEVSNLINRIPSLQNVHLGEGIDSCLALSNDVRNDKAKTPQAKKKKICSKPSMIPKRVTSSKLNKKNVGG